jgi:glycerate-2-kinase
MAAAARDVLGERIEAGLVVARARAAAALGRRFRRLAGEHPVPGRGSLAAGREVWRLLGRASAGDHVLLLLSGGASSLVELPAPGLRLPEVIATTRLLLASGASIGETNAVRKHLSRLKGGGLARRAAPARVTALLLSDVIGSPPDVIGSGPAAPDRTTFADALGIVRRHGLLERLPRPVRRHLEAGARGQRTETAKPGEMRVRHVVVGDVGLALAAAAAEARRRGYRPRVVTDRLRGEARRAGLRVARALERPGITSACLLFGGETTVTVRGGGLGGRSQELTCRRRRARRRHGRDRRADRRRRRFRGRHDDRPRTPAWARSRGRPGAERRLPLLRPPRRSLPAGGDGNERDGSDDRARGRRGPGQANARRTRSSSTVSASRRRRAKISAAGSTSRIEPEPCPAGMNVRSGSASPRTPS